MTSQEWEAFLFMLCVFMLCVRNSNLLSAKVNEPASWWKMMLSILESQFA